VALRAPLDGEGVLVRELDRNVLLVDAGQFAFEVVGVIFFLDIKARSKGPAGVS
jgi:hypothetical protein